MEWNYKVDIIGRETAIIFPRTFSGSAPDVIGFASDRGTWNRSALWGDTPAVPGLLVALYLCEGSLCRTLGYVGARTSLSLRLRQSLAPLLYTFCSPPSCGATYKIFHRVNFRFLKRHS